MPHLILILLLLLTACSPPEQKSQPASLEDRPLGMSAAEAEALESLEKVSEYPLYTMTSRVDYAGLPSQAAGAQDRSAGSGQDQDWGCSLFAALGDSEALQFGRNFDWDFSPALLLFNYPPQGYASLSMVDITFLGVAEKDWFNLDELPLENRRLLLEAPSLPFDGMNEQGLAIGMAAVPSGHRVRDPAKPTIGSIGIIRRVLDEARNVEEALAIFENYNVSMGEGPEIHYLLADRSGTAILIEYIEGEMVVTPQEHPWHQATNFLVGSFDDPQGLCWRYDRIAENLQAAQGVLTPDQALDLLMDVSQDVTQWSAVYSLSTGEVRIALGGEGGEVLTFTLKAP